MNKIKKFVGFILLCPGKTSKRFEIPFRSFLPETSQFCLDFPITVLKKQSHVFLTLTLVYWSHGSAGTPIFCQFQMRVWRESGTFQLTFVFCVLIIPTVWLTLPRYCLAKCYFTLTFSREKIRKDTFFLPSKNTYSYVTFLYSFPKLSKRAVLVFQLQSVLLVIRV